MLHFNEDELKNCDNATRECFISCQQEQYVNSKNELVPIPGIQNCLEKKQNFTKMIMYLNYHHLRKKKQASLKFEMNQRSEEHIE